MNRNILGLCVGIIVFAVASLHAQQISTATAKGEPRHGRIEGFMSEKDGVKRKGLRFISSDGKEKRQITENASVERNGGKWIREVTIIGEVLPNNKLVMLQKRKSVHSDDPSQERDSATPGEYWDEAVEVLNTDGDTIATNSFRTYPGEDLMTTSYWNNEFSKEGQIYFVYYRDENGGGNVEVYNVKGEKMAQGHASADIKSIEISSDGSMLAGYTYLVDGTSGKTTKHLFVLDCLKNQAKIVNAEWKNDNEEWAARFMLSSLVSPKLQSGEILIALGGIKESDGKKLRPWHGRLNFAEIPNDLSILLGRKGRK